MLSNDRVCSRPLRSALLLGVSFLGCLSQVGTASAQVVAPGFNANQLARNDDSSTGPVTLPFTVNYFGTTYTQTYVNNNGNITFRSASSDFTPVGLGANYRGQPIIAPFLADIDTRNPASGITSYGNGTYAGRTAFGVTWPGVGYFSSQADRTNTFQLILANRAETGTGNFDIYFNYGSIRFETGSADGGTGGLGGNSAAAGFSAGTGVAGTYYELPGSMVNGAFLDGGPFSLATGTNNNTPGQFLFPVRNGAVVLAQTCSAGDNASTTAVANCGPNRSYNGIFYTPTVGFTLNVLANTTITAASSADAVLVMPTNATTGRGTTPVTINVSDSATITATTRAGINLDGANGSGNGTINSAGRITAGSAAIQARTGAGQLAVTNSGTLSAPVGILGAGAQVGIVNSGTISNAVLGIAAQGLASTARNSGTINFGLAGIANVGSGAVSVSNTGTITRDPALPSILSQTLLDRLPANAADIDNQIDAATGRARLADGSRIPAAIAALSQAGAVTIDNAGTIAVSTPGIGIGAATGSGTGPITITNSGSVSSSLTAIFARSAGGNINVTNLTGGILSGGAYAVDTSGSAAATRIDNRGGILGPLALSNGSSVLNSGQFMTIGASTFGGGTFTNTGTVSLAGTPAAPTNATFGALQTFTNAGTIDLRTGTGANTLTIGGNYVGQNGNVLFQASTLANTSDRLVINGNASGSTNLFVSNLTPGTAFTTSPVLVQVNGTASTNAFTLAGTQNFGTLESVLVNGTSANGASTISLGAVPTAVGLSAQTAVIAARSIAFQGGTAVLDRMTQLRENTQRAAAGTPSVPPQALQYTQNTQYAALVSKDPIAPNLVPAAVPVDTSVRPAVWARAFGDLERRSGSTSFSFGGSTFNRDLGYTQSSGGLLGGTDVVFSGITKPDDGLIVGVLGGYTISTVRLNQAAGRQDYDGGTVGTYATYINGPAFVDAMFKVDLLGLDIIAPGLRQATGLQNYNFITNVGYRFPLANGFYVEPTAGLEYVNTQFNRQAGLTVNSVPLQNGDALRGRVGARMGTEIIVGDLRWEPSITTYVYSVLTESRTLGAFNGISSVTGLRDEGKVRGEVQASLNVFNLKTGLSGFIRADYRVGEDLVAGGGRVGVRYQW